MLMAILLLLATFLLAALVVFTAKTLAALSRLTTFLDAQDIDLRRTRLEAQRAREVHFKSLESFFKDTRGILGKLHTVAEELSPHHRETVEMSAPLKMPVLAPEPERDSAELMTRVMPAPSAAALAAAAPAPSSGAAQRAAGLSRPRGPRPAQPPPMPSEAPPRSLPPVVPPPIKRPRSAVTLPSMTVVRASAPGDALSHDGEGRPS
jgi:hypothetical protein